MQLLLSPAINYLFGDGWGGTWGAYTIYTSHPKGNLLHKQTYKIECG